MIYFSGDEHFNHIFLLTKCRQHMVKHTIQRDPITDALSFNTIEDGITEVLNMNKYVIDRLNEQTEEGDTIISAGDVIFKYSWVKELNPSREGVLKSVKDVRSKLKASFIYVEGNHDTSNGSKDNIKEITMDICGRSAIIRHHPIEDGTDPHYAPYDICLHGHSHEKRKTSWSDDGNILNINICLDATGFNLLSKQDIHNIYISNKERKALKEGASL